MLSSKLSEAIERIGDATHAFPWTDGVAYADWLAQTYYYVRHSTRLLAASAGRFGFDPRGDALHHRFGAHMGEEHKHELLALHDLKNMNLGMLDRFTELSSTRSFYQIQYTKVEHQDPLALFGYILPLELLSIKHGPYISETVRKTWGAKCVSFVKVHVEEDDSHVEKALAALEGMTPEQTRLVVESIDDTVYGYVGMLKQIRERTALLTKPSAKTTASPLIASA